MGQAALPLDGVAEWLEGDPAEPAPPPSRTRPGARNVAWQHLALADVICMPDEWEYPWFAAWDLAFHCVTLAHVDPSFAKEQLLLMCREWAMHPDGQLPAYEWAFGDVNPPVHAWAAWQVYLIDASSGEGDTDFLVRVFTKLLLNFGWWVNRKDADGSNLFEGGFLGMDNIGLFDRSAPLPDGWRLEESDATSWVAFYCLKMLTIAVELAAACRLGTRWPRSSSNTSSASRMRCADSVRRTSRCGTTTTDSSTTSWCMRTARRSGCGAFDGRPAAGARRRARAASVRTSARLTSPRGLRWLQRRRPGPAGRAAARTARRARTAAIICWRCSSPSGCVACWAGCSTSRSSCPRTASGRSRRSYRTPFTSAVEGQQLSIDYEPGESRTGLFGGNSNWRGPIWFPVNVLLADALRTYHDFLGDDFTLEVPTGSGAPMTPCARRLI